MNKNKNKKKTLKRAKNVPATFVKSDRGIEVYRKPAGFGTAIQAWKAKPIRIHHSEMIARINYHGSAFHVVNTQVIQPGLFRWLGPIATRYEQYEVNSLHFHYLSTSGTEHGSVALMFDADVKDEDPGDLVTMMSNQYSVLLPVWKNASLSITDKGVLNPVKRHYTRPAVPPSPYDHKTYDVGKLVLATDGIDNSPTNKGMVMIEYDITLYSPCLPAEQGGVYEGTAITAEATYSYPTYASHDGSMPVQVVLPNADEIADGAVAGHEIFRLLDNDYLALALNATGTTITGNAWNVNTGSGVTASTGEVVFDTNESVDIAKYYRSTGAFPWTSWIQPRFINANFATITSFILSFMNGSSALKFV